VEQAVAHVSASVGERDACKLLGLHRGIVQRRRAAHAVMAVIASIETSNGEWQRNFRRDLPDKYDATSSVKPRR